MNDPHLSKVGTSRRFWEIDPKVVHTVFCFFARYYLRTLRVIASDSLGRIRCKAANSRGMVKGEER